MIIYNIFAAFLMLFVVGIGFRRFGWNSLIGFALIGSSIYSLPLVVGYYKPFDSQDYFAEVSLPALIVGILIWIVYLFTVIVLPVNVNKNSNVVEKKNFYLESCLLLSIFGLAYIFSKNGFLFFLNARNEIILDEVAILWRWILIFGVVISFIEKKRIYIFVFSFFIFIYFMAGDRTILAITIAACFIYNLQFNKVRKFLPSSLSIFVLFLSFIVLIFGKLIYLFIKEPTLESLAYFISPDVLVTTFLSFEPLGTHSHLEVVVNNKLTADPHKFFLSIFGNFLLVPSFFDVSTNYFNEEISGGAFQNLNYGVAGHFYASAYFGLGVVGVVLVSFLYLVGLNFIERISFKSNGILKVAFIITGATLAIYIHRNGIDNIFSFVRQIFIVFIFVVVCSKLISKINLFLYKSR